VRTIFKGVDGAFLLDGLSQTETSEGLMAVSAAMHSDLKRLVYLSVQHADRAPHLPHVGNKIAIEAAVQSSGLAWTILRPSNFFQNDLWLRDAIVGYGVYPQPLGDLGVSRVDTRDLADLAVLALTQSGHEGKTYDVVGPRALTGAQVAEVWSATLGKPIPYGGNDLAAWEGQALQHFPPWLAYDLRLMDDHFQRHGLGASEADVATLTRVLGHAPRRFEEFAADSAASWTGADAGARR
jgi:uncharacterized protein YbjT (DUF2867 family)